MLRAKIGICLSVLSAVVLIADNATAQAPRGSSQQTPAQATNPQPRPAYRANDILDRLVVPDPAAGLGASRRICVGTETECRPVTRVRTDVTLDLMVAFDLNSSALTAEARRNLDEFATALKDARLAAVRFQIEGHTDARGSPDRNQTLSERRAQAVADYLLSQGVTADRLETRAFGETRPRASDPYDAANRRVETRVIP